MPWRTAVLVLPLVVCGACEPSPPTTPIDWSDGCQATKDAGLDFRKRPFPTDSSTTASSATCLANGASLLYFFPVPRAGAISVSVTAVRPAQSLWLVLGRRDGEVGYPYDCSHADLSPWRIAGAADSVRATVESGDYCLMVSMTQSEGEVYHTIVMTRP